MRAAAFGEDPRYGQTLAREFSVMAPENELKFCNLQPARGRYEFGRAEELLRFAEANGMRVFGHTLVWNVFPAGCWLPSAGLGRSELIQVMQDHIARVVGQFRGRIFAWDVVNEAVSNGGGLTPSVWRGIGDDYIEMAFRLANQADPQARLFYNDYAGEGLGRKANDIYELLRGLLARGVPIHGVGLQMHLDEAGRTVLGETLTAATLAENIGRLTALGLEVHISEMDVRLRLPATAEQLDNQARLYGQLVPACLSNPRCTSLGFWGFTDRYSSVPETDAAFGSALLFDANYQPKPAYETVRQALAAR